MAEMKQLVFGEGLMSPTLDGKKLFTVRKFRSGAHDFKEGETVIGKFKDGLNILLRITKDSKIASFEDLKSLNQNPPKDGYCFDREYFEDLKSFPGYEDITWNTLGAVVFYEVLKVSDVPVVSFNEFTK